MQKPALRIIFLSVLLSAMTVNLPVKSLAQGRLLSGPDESTVVTQANTLALLNPSDQLAFETQADNFDSFSALAQYLGSSFSDEEMKARSIYTWIAKNIHYDQSAKISPNQTDQSSATVWAKHTAVCEGFANLFKDMCTSAGLESRVIKGYANKFTTNNKMKYPNHAWNSVKINGKWQLLDVTWASQNISEIHETMDTRQLNQYFLVAPEEMIKSHLPEDPYWQLQNLHVNLLTFLQGPAAVQKILDDAATSFNPTNFEALIAKYEQKDSLDRAIAYFERMEPNPWNHAKEYGLGIAYFYKAQQILRLRNPNPQTVKNRAKQFYIKSLDQLDLLKKEDYGFEFSRALAENVAFRLDTLR